jgi:tetratricopeptide (TPR) repeat protein
MPVPQFSPRIRRRFLAGCALAAVVVGLVFGYREFDFQSRLKAAADHSDRGHQARAIRDLAVCRERRPDHPGVLLLASRVARRSGQWDLAKEFLDHFERLHGESDDLILQNLLLRAARGELESSAIPLKSRLSQAGLSPETATQIREALVTGLLYRFRWDEARVLLATWIESEPSNPSAWMLKGKLHEQSDEDPLALETYRKIVDELDPEQDEARSRLANLLSQQSYGTEALEYLDPARARLGRNEQLDVLRGVALRQAGRDRDAKAWLEECKEYFPENPILLTELGKFAVGEGDFANAELLLRNAIRFDPANVTTRYQYAQVLQRNGLSREAQAERETVQRIEDDLKQIQKLIRKSLPDAPNDPNLHHEIGAISLRAGRASDAVRWFEITLQIDPMHGPTHQSLAGYYQAVGNPILAARHRAMAQRAGIAPAPAKKEGEGSR